jgi:dolichol-phosphate mannosyltransferase
MGKQENCQCRDKAGAAAGSRRVRIVVILPTYNERENIGLMIDALQDQFRKIPHEMAILVVDDSSPDGTADVVRQKISSFANVHLLTGEKRGLGAAYIRGIGHALDVLNADIIMQMDADFSHNPEDVPRLIAALDGGADFVIGSRYVQGGKIPDNWSLLRRMISRWGNRCARYIAGLNPIRDCTAGFRVIRASVIRRIDMTNLKVQGYAFLMALLHAAVSHGAVVREVPVVYTERERGETKLGIKDIIGFILNAWWIRFDSSRTFIKFAVVGASGVVVNLGAFTSLLHMGLNKYIASPAAIELSIISNFLLNNYWTFAERNSRDNIHIRGLKFNLVSFLSLGVSYSVFVLMSLLFPSVLPQINQAAGIIPAMLINYFGNAYWTFKKTSG